MFGRLSSRIVAGRINRGAGAPAAEAAAAEGVPAAIAVLQHSTPKSAFGILADQTLVRSMCNC